MSCPISFYRFSFTLTALLPHQMPVMDGIESVTLFRGQEVALQRPVRQFIIGISASNDDVSRINALECGMDAFVLKPFSLDTITKLKVQRHRKISFDALVDYYTDVSTLHKGDQAFCSALMEELFFKVEDANAYAAKLLKLSPVEPMTPKPSIASFRKPSSSNLDAMSTGEGISMKSGSASTKSAGNVMGLGPNREAELKSSIKQSIQRAVASPASMLSKQASFSASMNQRVTLPSVNEDTANQRPESTPQVRIELPTASVSTKREQPVQPNSPEVVTPRTLSALVSELESHRLAAVALQKTVDQQARSIASQQEMIMSQQLMIGNLLAQLQGKGAGGGAQ